MTREKFVEHYSTCTKEQLEDMLYETITRYSSELQVKDEEISKLKKDLAELRQIINDFNIESKLCRKHNAIQSILL